MARLLAITLLLLIAASSQAQTMSRYALNVGDFSQLKVTNSVNVDYRCNPDSAGYAVFHASPHNASLLVFSNNKNRLEIQLSTDSEPNAGNLPTVTVYSRFLTKVENSGDSTVRVLSVASGPSFKARLVGNGRLVARDIDAIQVDGSINTGNGLLVLYGRCSSAKLNNTGKGNIQADQLQAETVKCVQVGTGAIGCCASSHLTIYGASGSVYYQGNPQIKNRSIGVDVQPID